jgi:capsular exopolysaccharide synthesis family protein
MPAAQRSGIEGLSLRDRSESLRIQASLQTGNVAVAELASIPTSPSSPKVVQNTALGGVLGLLIGVGLAFLLQQLDRRMKEPEDLVTAFRLPLLGVIPESNAYRSDKDSPLPSRESEAFRTLRAHLRYYNVDRDVRTVLVTSAAPGEGKSTVARYLAEAAATLGTETLLIEADLRRPALADRMGAHPPRGLADVLIRACPAPVAVWTLDDASDSNGTTLNNPLKILFAGATPPNPVQLIESQAMHDLLLWASKAYELVVIDTPPLTVVSDAISLIHKVDGVIIVSRLGTSTTTAAERLRERLSTLGAPTLGVVANAYSQYESGGYDYHYDAQPPEPKGSREPRKLAASSNDLR